MDKMRSCTDLGLTLKDGVLSGDGIHGYQFTRRGDGSWEVTGLNGLKCLVEARVIQVDGVVLFEAN